MARKKNIPPLVEKIDAYGELKAEADRIAARMKLLREELIDMIEGSAEGVAYRATVTKSVRTSLDTTKIKAEMGAEWVADHSRETNVVTLSVEKL